MIYTKILSIFPLLIGVGMFMSAQTQSPEHLRYIEKYKDVAIREMERAGVPASIKLAQGILESNAGQSYLAKRANNHFGIKCGNDWNGKTVYRKDDDFDDQGKLIESCFRSYRTVEAGYVAHSEFLRDPKKNYRYGFLFQIDPRDYRRWAYGLKRAGYATSATYPEKLIDIIERYQLDQYDNMSTIDLDTPNSELIAGVIMQTNDVKYTLASSQETVADIASRTDVALRKLIDYNEHLRSGDQSLSEGQKIYLQPKRNSYRGRQKYHVVQPGETMLDISNLYGIKLDKLHERNRMLPGQQPAAKTDIKLRGGKVKSSPRLRQPGAEEKERPQLDPIVTDPDEDFIDMEEENNQPSPPPVIIVPPSTPPSRDTGRVITPPLPPAVSTPPTPQREEEDPLAEDIFSPTPPPINPSPAPPPVITPQPERPTSPPPVVIDQPDRPTAQPTPPPVDRQASYHTVATGDTLWNISRRYNTTVEALQRLNQLSGNNIKVGQRLRVK